MRIAKQSYLVVAMAVLTCFAATHVLEGQTPALRIVVIEGEDAVNIIQQKTAVAPVVEVRDRNDLPVAGVPVTFSVNGGGASFGGGLQSITVTTNAAGRAAALGLNPVASGPLQINVTATAQGQIATATINQTNLLTAAGAAPSTGGSGSASNSSGGGLSAKTIGVLGAAAAGGIVAATALTREDESPVDPSGVYAGQVSGSFTFTFTPATGGPNCSWVQDFSGTLTLTLAVVGDVVSGSGVLESSRVITANTCATQGPPVGDRLSFVIDDDLRVSGTSSAVIARWEFSEVDGSVSEEGSVQFSGAISNDTINGTFTAISTEISSAGIARLNSSVPGTLRRR